MLVVPSTTSKHGNIRSSAKDLRLMFVSGPGHTFGASVQIYLHKTAASGGNPCVGYAYILGSLKRPASRKNTALDSALIHSLKGVTT
jgi:hypothetical protein